jgi:hypothetical protein
MTFFKLINDSPIEKELKDELHELRKYRNKWVHVNTPWDDQELIENPENTENELEKMALSAAKILRKIIYENHCV